MRGVIISLLQYPFMAWCLVKHKDFTFYLYVWIYFYLSKSRKKSHVFGLDIIKVTQKKTNMEVKEV